MPIKNGRYKDSQGNVRHFETNEYMVVVDNGQKTLKQKLTEILTSVQESIRAIQETVSSKVDALFVKEITGDKTQLQTVDKTNLVNAINELKRTGGGGSGATLNVFKRTGGTWGVFTATQATTTFDVAGFNGTEKCLDVYYKGLPLIPEKDFNVNQTGTVTLGFELAVGESVDYCVSDVSFDYNELANKPNLDLKADKLYVDGEFAKSLKIVNAVDSDFNNYTTIGIYRITNNNQANKPPFERVQYGILEVIPIPSSNAIKQIAYDLADNKIWHRSKASLNEAWSEWKQLVTTDITTTLDTKIGDLSLNSLKVKSPDSFGNDFNNANIIGMYHVINCQSWLNKPPTIENVGNLIVMGGTNNNSLSKVQYFIPFNNKGLYIRTRGYGLAEWMEWKEIATTSKINNLTLLNGWTPTWGASNNNFKVEQVGDLIHVRGIITGGATTNPTIIVQLPQPVVDMWVNSITHSPTGVTPTCGMFYLNASGQLTVNNVAVDSSKNHMFDFCYRAK